MLCLGLTEQESVADCLAVGWEYLWQASVEEPAPLHAALFEDLIEGFALAAKTVVEVVVEGVAGGVAEGSVVVAAPGQQEEQVRVLVEEMEQWFVGLAAVAAAAVPVL